MRRLSPHLSADGRCGSLHRTHPTSGIVENIPRMPGLSRAHASIITYHDSSQFTTNRMQNSLRRIDSCVGRRINSRPTTRPGSKSIGLVRRHPLGAFASCSTWPLRAFVERDPSLLHPLFARARPLSVSYTHLMLTFRLNSRPLQQRIEGMERRTSVRETSHDILYEPRTRAARACIAAGVPVASSCIPSCAVCVADRTPVGPQIVFAFPRRYAAGLLGLLPPRPGSRTTSRRLRGGLGPGAVAVDGRSRARRRGAAWVPARA